MKNVKWLIPMAIGIKLHFYFHIPTGIAYFKYLFLNKTYVHLFIVHVSFLYITFITNVGVGGEGRYVEHFIGSNE